VEDDKLSYFEIKGILCENLGYKEVWKIHWCTPGEGPLSDHIRLMFEDNDVLKMLQANEGCELIDIYIEHDPKDVVGEGSVPHKDDRLSESEQSDVNNLDHLESDEDDDELV
ncbi:hypothetical protein FRX31_019957, partial [Thalictrum thalictroides]